MNSDFTSVAALFALFGFVAMIFYFFISPEEVVTKSTKIQTGASMADYRIKKQYGTTKKTRAEARNQKQFAKYAGIICAAVAVIAFGLSFIVN